MKVWKELLFRSYFRLDSIKAIIEHFVAHSM